MQENKNPDRDVISPESRKPRAASPAPEAKLPPEIPPAPGKIPSPDAPAPGKNPSRSDPAFTAGATRINDPVKERKPKSEEGPKAPRDGEKPKKKKAPEQKPVTRDRGGILISLIKAAVYVAVILTISGFIGVTGIRWGNDIFAFVKEEKSATVIIPDNASITEIAMILKEQDLISEPDAFKFYIGYKYRNKELIIIPGTYELKSTMNYDQMINAIREKAPERQIVAVTVPEGYTVDQIIDLLVNEYHIGTREGYVKAINEYEYDYEFMKKLSELELSGDRKYRLEGYLFPARYEIYTDLSEVGVIDYFLQAFAQRFDKSYYDRLIELDMNLDEAITLASMIQAEGKYDSDYYYISSVFHNRMNSSDFKKLESDATIQYFLAERKEDLAQSDLNTDNPYNTYLYEGLPPSAICNPGLEAIHAALYPEDSKYFYFVADVDGHTLFASTNAEHERNKATVKANKEAAAAEGGAE